MDQPSPIAETPTRIGLRPALALVCCGAAALFWELVLIRWLGSCIRIVAYYSNFVLIAAFFGLGVGALLAGRELRLRRVVFVLVAACVLLGVLLSGFRHPNPQSPDELIWIGAPFGVLIDGEAPEWLNLWIILPGVYLAVAGLFVVFGQWIGQLFRGQPPILAYSYEIGGSVLGIGLFAGLSALGAGPTVWFVVGFGLLLPIADRRPLDWVLGLASMAAVFGLASPFAAQFDWSPYYRIYVTPLTRVADREQKGIWSFEQPLGHVLTVNNDYHQMVLDLRPRQDEPPLLAEWRELYEAPYRDQESLPPGPVLVVGAGTGNDVAAALRRTDRQVHAVEIDPEILALGRELNPERPYQDPRVRLVVDDARSYFSTTSERYALVVFGFLDSHTLLSSFSSLRLDNFVYTLESMKQVERLLVPGGKVALTFAAQRWMRHRLTALLEQAFERPVEVRRFGRYANGVLFEVRDGGALPEADGPPGSRLPALVPEDNWPYLYLQARRIPGHYWGFLGTVLALGCLALLLLPRGQRRIRLPYFLLGAAFFLLETSNVVSLSLLFGSTWEVNALVFSGILGLVLLGNLTAARLGPRPLGLAFVLLAANLGLAACLPTGALLAIGFTPLRLLVAVLVFLGPVYFAALIFAGLIRDEPNLFKAYGSNVLGAVVGGTLEYLSLMFGFKMLLALTLLLYLLVFLLLPESLRRLRAG